MIDNGDGTWNWSLDTSGLSGLQTVTVTATDSDTASQFTTFDLDVELITADLPASPPRKGPSPSTQDRMRILEQRR